MSNPIVRVPLILMGLLPALSEAQDKAQQLAVEEEMLDEINLLRADPQRYIKDVLRPLRATAKRLPADGDQPFEAYRVYLSASAIDYVELDEGETEEDALAILDEAIQAVNSAGRLPILERNEVLNEAARFFSQDFMTVEKRLPPHIDSLGRAPTARIASFGLTRKVMNDWAAFAGRLPPDKRVTVRVFKKGDHYFRVDLPAAGGYRYWSVPDAFAGFVKQHGTETTIPRIEKQGFEARLEVDVARRRLKAGGETIGYPLPLPTHGENVVWGAWSRKLAARGMVCWWVLDPGIQGRGHRKLLLDSDFKYCGIGVTWSRKIGWVATLDVTAEPLVTLPQKRESNKAMPR